METVLMLSHLAMLSFDETQKMRAIEQLLPLIDKKMEEERDNPLNSELFWKYFRGVLVMVRDSIPEQKNWLVEELSLKIERIEVRHLRE